MRIYDVLREGPIGDYKTFGDFNKSSSFKKERDRRLITNPPTIEYVKKKFNNSPYVFNLYFVNTPKAKPHMEVGSVTIDWVRENLGNDVADSVSQRVGEEDAVNIIFTNNEGSERVPMTAWIMAHRIGHAMARRANFGDNDAVSYSFNTARDAIFDALSSILAEYGRTNFPKKFVNLRVNMSRADELTYLYFFNKVCTFRSARENNVRDWFEIMHELFAQYITTGKIKFNDAPSVFGNRHSGRTYRIKGTEELGYVNDELHGLSATLGYYFDTMLGSASDKIYVM